MKFQFLFRFRFNRITNKSKTNHQKKILEFQLFAFYFFYLSQSNTSNNTSLAEKLRI